MKSILTFLILLVFATSTLASSAAKGDSNTFLSNYEIKEKSKNIYELSYANTSEKYIIEVCPKEMECCYLVRNEHFEVMYLCSKNGFGLRKMPDKLQKIDIAKYGNFLNNESFNQQSILTPIKKTRMEAMGLIACFLPLVIKDESHEIVFKHTRFEKNLTSLH